MTIPEEKRAGYISLKEASERFGYSQDYLGQLIRKGKIDGKLVYSHVAWVTTPEAVEKYIALTKDKRKKKTSEMDDSSLEAEEEVQLENFAYEANVATDTHASYVTPGVDESEESRLGKWLIIFFRVLILAVLLVAMFVFYLLTTAFGEEVRTGEHLSASTTFSLSANQNRHE